MLGIAYYEYIPFDNEKFFTVVVLPQKDGKFPTVITRSPYVSALENKSEAEITDGYFSGYQHFVERGYAVVIQHCRGQGKSTGEFIPYVIENKDSRALRNWVREQSFYNGELFLLGGSYTASLHYAATPFEEDIKGAILEVQDTERYRLWYRNGQMRKGHANWHFGLYKQKCNLQKSYSMKSFSALPLKGLSKVALGEYAEDFEQMLEAQNPNHRFWNTVNGGIDAKDATENVKFPILLTTGYNDFYVGGTFSMWNKMSENTRKKCALLVSPYDHGDGYNQERGIHFPEGARREHFGAHYGLDWLDYVRLGKNPPFKTGVITYYRAFENRWEEDFYGVPTKEESITLGEGKTEFIYDPENPPSFCPEGIFQDKNDDGRVISFYTNPLDKDVFVKGKMKMILRVSSDCPDTSFHVSISIKKEQGDYRLRHDITSLLYQLGEYKENEIVSLAIDPEAVDPDDVEMLQDMVIAAVNEAMRAADEDSAQNMSKLTGGLNLGGLF